jgi:hypothetical protein
MERRDLTFKNYDEIINEINNLKKNGYQEAAKWNLEQICKHVSYFMKASLDGSDEKVPWIIKVTIGKLLKKSLLSPKKSKPNSMTDPNSVFQRSENDKEEIKIALELLNRLKSKKENLKSSPLLGDLTNEEWDFIHIKHWSNHLSCLVPK